MTIFLLEDLPARCEWYYKAGWREERLGLQRYLSEYGQSPEWQHWLKMLSDHSDTGVAHLDISAQEKSDPENITRWPNPGAMVNCGLKQGTPRPPGRDFLQYLNDWFYKDLSEQSHLGGLGLVKRGVFLLQDFRHDPRNEQSLQKFKYDQVGKTITLVLALASEVEAYFKFGLGERAKYVWALLLSDVPVSKELYEKRYASLLGSSHP